jgi:hypothetical protein
MCLSPPEFESCSWWGVLDTTLCDKVCQWLVTGRWFSPGTLASCNKTDRHDITEILFKVALNTINQLNFFLNMMGTKTFLCDKYSFPLRHACSMCGTFKIMDLSWKTCVSCFPWTHKTTKMKICPVSYEHEETYNEFKANKIKGTQQ